MNDSWMWTIGWGLTLGVGSGGLGGGEQKGKNWDNYNRTIVKYLIKMKNPLSTVIDLRSFKAFKILFKDL